MVVKLLYRTDKKNLILSLNDISRLLNVLTAPFCAYNALYYPSLKYYILKYGLILMYALSIFILTLSIILILFPHLPVTFNYIDKIIIDHLKKIPDVTASRSYFILKNSFSTPPTWKLNQSAGLNKYEINNNDNDNNKRKRKLITVHLSSSVKLVE